MGYKSKFNCKTSNQYYQETAFAPKHQFRWKLEEVYDLINMHDDGFSFKVIANYLHRSEAACYLKYHRLKNSEDEYYMKYHRIKNSEE